MKELVLLFLYNNKALIGLVDYDAYTVAVKTMELKDDSLETGDLSELIKSGKLRLYRDARELDASSDAWLAYDSVRGCLAVNRDGMVLHEPTHKYIKTLIERSNYYRYGWRREGQYNPRRFGEPVKSFYEVVKEVEYKHNASLKDSVVRDEIIDRTGILIEYNGDSSYYGGIEYFVLDLFGQTIDRLDIVGSSNNVNLTIKNGTVELLYVDCPNSFTLKVSKSSVTELRVSERQQALHFDFDLVSNVPQKYPKLTTEFTSCKLSELSSYQKDVADLSMFRALRVFKHCWNRYSKSMNNVLDPINLILPGLRDTEFIDCFKDVYIQNLLPYTKTAGVFDITDIGVVKSSFWNFAGVDFIRGTVSDSIKESFISNEFAGKFDVTVGYLESSFGYVSKLLNKSYGDYEIIEAKYNPEGVINVVLSGDAPKNGSGYYMLGNLSMSSGNSFEITAWKRVENITYSNGPTLPKLYLDLNNTVTYVIHCPVYACRVVAPWSIKNSIVPVFKECVHILQKGEYLYDNVRNYDERCFSGKKFKPTYLGVIPEGLYSIGARAFYNSSGIDYLVIPKSCEEIGAAAFSEMKSSSGDLTTICVYKDSWAHKWSKGKNLKIKVIESLDDIPKPTSKETESDFLAAFIETPLWAINSKAYVAKILTMTPVDITEHLSVVTTLSPELVKFFDDIYATLEKETTDSNGNKVRVDLEAPGLDVPCDENSVSRYALHAAALNALHGSCIEMLNLAFLARFNWTVKQAYDVFKWVGTPKVSRYYGGLSPVTLYLRGAEVLYVGCGTLQDNGIVDGLHIMAPVLWSVPKNVLSSEILFGPDVEGRLVVSHSWRTKLSTIKVHGEVLQDEVKDKFNDFLHDSMVYVGSVGSTKSGRVSVKTYLVYDICNHKLYKFSNAVTTGRYSWKENTDLGTYRGEMAIEEYAKLSGVAAIEKECLESRDEVDVAKKAPAPPCYELEFCRTHSNFELEGPKPKVQLFIEFLSNSGLVKRATKSVVDSRVCSPIKKLNLPDGTLIYTGKSANEYTHLLGIDLPDGKFYGFEAGFDMLYFANLADQRLPKGSTYPNPNGGYLEIVDRKDLFAVTPTRPVKSDRAYFYQDNKGIKRNGMFVALDFTSGKLVLAFDVNEGAGVLCSFASAKDVREFYTAFGCKFFAPFDEYTESNFYDTMYIQATEEPGKYTMTIHPYKSHARIANSLMAIGGYTPSEKLNITQGVYNETVLKYCRC